MVEYFLADYFRAWINVIKTFSLSLIWKSHCALPSKSKKLF